MKLLLLLGLFVLTFTESIQATRLLGGAPPPEDDYEMMPSDNDHSDVDIKMEKVRSHRININLETNHDYYDKLKMGGGFGRFT